MTRDPNSIPDDFGQVHFGLAELGDQRRTNRLVDCANRIVRRPDQTLPKKLQTPASLDGFYRLMNTRRVTHDAVLHPHRQRTRECCASHSGVVLMIHDSTELDYTSITSLKTLGQIGNGKKRGYICHNSLAVDAEQGEVIGLINQQLHHRSRVASGETIQERRQRTDRESRLWSDAVRSIGSPPVDQQTGVSTRWIHVADRGSDSFEALETFHQHGGFLIRSRGSRKVRSGHDQAEDRDRILLKEYAQELPKIAMKEVQVRYRPADKRGRTRRPVQPQRTTLVNIGVGPVEIPIPARPRGEHGPDSILAWVLHVIETNPVKTGEPLEWILLTDQAVTTAEDALRMVEWYERRWIIEEFHKAMKTGCDIENLQFTTEGALQPTIALLSVVSVFLLTLRDLARREDATKRPASDLVDPFTQKILGHWRKDKNWPTWNVREFVLALARLGGHQNRKGDGLPGWLTLWRGWQELQAMLTGARLANFTRKCGEN